MCSAQLGAARRSTAHTTNLCAAQVLSRTRQKMENNGGTLTVCRGGMNEAWPRSRFSAECYLRVGLSRWKLLFSIWVMTGDHALITSDNPRHENWCWRLLSASTSCQVRSRWWNCSSTSGQWRLGAHRQRPQLLYIYCQLWVRLHLCFSLSPFSVRRFSNRVTPK